MDPLTTLPVRFHLNGEFLNTGRVVHYIGGSEAMSYIDRDKVSYPEIVGHLRDHMNVLDGTKLHWLFPGRSLSTGLWVMFDGKSCIEMSECIVEGGVADIYVEAPEVQEVSETEGDDEQSDFEDEMDALSVDESEADSGNERQEVDILVIYESRAQQRKASKFL